MTKNEIALKLTGLPFNALDRDAQAIAQYAALVITNLQKDLSEVKGSTCTNSTHSPFSSSH